MTSESINLREGVDEHGEIEDRPVATYYVPFDYPVRGDGWIGFVADDGATDIEVRVPHSVLISMGWTPPDMFRGDIRTNAEISAGIGDE